MSQEPKSNPRNQRNVLIQVLEKIPFFRGLSSGQVRKILGACNHRSCRPGEKLCRNNTASDEMYILLSGELAVVTAEGVKFARIVPVTTVGEMGIVTGQPRSATVEVLEPSNVLVIRKAQFDPMLREDPDMRLTVYRHIIDVLSSKLNNDNIRLRDYQIEKSAHEQRIAALEQQLRQEDERFEIAAALAEETGDLSRDEIELHLTNGMEHLVHSVLVVDDEADFRRLVVQALPAYSVMEAADGQEALSIVREEKLDLVITDIRMPGMDGFGLLTNLRSQFPQLPVVAVSGFVDAAELEALDFDGFIEKPLSLQDLQNLVQETISRAAS